MKKLISSIFVVAMMAAFLSSCGGKDPINPNPNPTPGDHGALWSYDIGFGSMADIIPAIDENDNSYYAIYNLDANKAVAFALDKDGNELWKTELVAESVGKVIYSNGKIFISTNSPTGVFCFDASSGNLLWAKDLSAEYDFAWIPQIAVNNSKLYISSGQLFYSYLVAYDFDGTELWVKQGPTMGSSFNLNVNGNALLFSDGDYLYRYDDNGASCDSVWAYKIPISKSVKNNNSIITMFDMPMDESGNIYIRDENIHIVSLQGQLVKEILLDASFDNSASNITLTSNNDILIGKGDLVKFNSNGDVVWVTDIHGGLIINPFFAVAPVIASNGDLYDAQLFGLYSIKENGSLNWKENAETGGGAEFGNLHSPVLTHEGNIISVSAEQKFVRCFKGDGKGLATGGWPKPFGDYGNTSSK